MCCCAWSASGDGGVLTITVLKRQDNGDALYKVQSLLYEEVGRCNRRVLLARQLDLIDEQLRLDGESPAGACALPAVVAFRCELSGSFCVRMCCSVRSR